MFRRFITWLTTLLLLGSCYTADAQSTISTRSPNKYVLLASDATSGPASTPAKPKNNADTNAREAADFLKELDALKPEEMSVKAETISQELLSQLRFGPAIEQSKQRRAAWQRLRVELAKDLESDESLLEQLRARLTTQLAQVEQQSQGDSASANARSRAIVEASGESIRNLQRRIDRVREHVAKLDHRIRDAVTTEQAITDRMEIAKSSTRDFVGFELPDDSALRFEFERALPNHTADKLTTDKSPTDKPRPQKSFADLLKDLGIKFPVPTATASTANRKDRSR